MPNISLSILFFRYNLSRAVIGSFLLLFSSGVISQPLSDTLSAFQLNWSFQKAPLPKKNYFLFNPQAYNATLMQNYTLMSYKQKTIGAGIGRELMLNSNAYFLPRQVAFAPIQGMPVYPQYIPVAMRPGLSMFNTKSSGATLLQFGNLMDGRQRLTGGQMQLGKMWRIY